MSKVYGINLDGREFSLIEIDGLVIGFPNDMAYEVASSKVLKYPIQTLETAAKRLLKRKEATVLENRN